MRTAAKLLACSLGVFGAAQLNAQTNVVSDPVGFFKVSISPGANFISAPLHKVHAYRGLVASVSANTVTLNGNPNFGVNQFAPMDGFAQYVLIVKSDADKTAGASNNITGDWWNITANAAGTVTVDTNQGPASLIAASDRVEIRKKTSMQDLFGHTNTTVILNKDNDAAPSSTQEDVIRFVNGTQFGTEIIYHDGSLTGGVQGYLVGENGPYDGSTITVDPDEPLMVFRKAGSTSTNVVALGQVQTTKLTHYFGPGANTFSSAFPANAPLNQTGLEAVIFRDSNAAPSTSEEDVIRAVNGTQFGDDIVFHDGTLNGGTPVWLVGPNLDDTFPILPGKGYLYFVKASSGGRVWRQNVPFNP